tara:strand:- start:683 stop:1105 length:423 start_codon:yes stop_codon:yes gene_type:complete
MKIKENWKARATYTSTTMKNEKQIIANIGLSRPDKSTIPAIRVINLLHGLGIETLQTYVAKSICDDGFEWVLVVKATLESETLATLARTSDILGQDCISYRAGDAGEYKEGFVGARPYTSFDGSLFFGTRRAQREGVRLS